MNNESWKEVTLFSPLAIFKKSREKFNREFLYFALPT
jgi:hypothetical protein